MNLPPIVSENTRIIPFMLMTWTTAYIIILNLIPKPVWVSVRVMALTRIFRPIFPAENKENALKSCDFRAFMVAETGLEPATSGL